MNMHQWRKSTRSDGGENCVEVGTAPGEVAVRDTKWNGAGPLLHFDRKAWRSFVSAAKAGAFDRG